MTQKLASLFYICFRVGCRTLCLFCRYEHVQYFISASISVQQYKLHRGNRYPTLFLAVDVISSIILLCHLCAEDFFEHLQRLVTMAPESFFTPSNVVHRLTVVAHPLQMPLHATSSVMVGSFVVDSISVQQWLKSTIFQTTRLCCVVFIRVS